MPDISMCLLSECPSSRKCYRFMATPSKPVQCYSDFILPPKRKKCDYYIKWKS